jgi:hypothetical protein
MRTSGGDAVNDHPYLSLWESIGLLSFSTSTESANETWREREIAAGRDRAEVENDEEARVFAALDALDKAADAGIVTVVGRHPHDHIPRRIPTEDWRTLEIDPIGGPDGTGAAMPAALPEDEVPSGFPRKLGGPVQQWFDLRFLRIEVEKLPSVTLDDLTLRCAAWMRSRRAERGDEKKELLRELAGRVFTGLTVRQFNDAYGIVYQRSRGRPPKNRC